MAIEQWGLLLSLVTLIITISGWVYTYNKQVDILRETRTYSVADRELARLRELKVYVRDLSRTILAFSFVCHDFWINLDWRLNEGPSEESNNEQLRLTRLFRDTWRQVRLLRSDPEYEVVKNYMPNKDEFETKIVKLQKAVDDMPVTEDMFSDRKRLTETRDTLHDLRTESQRVAGEVSLIYADTERLLSDSS